MEREKKRMGKRGMKNTFAFYDGYTYPDIDTTNLQPDQMAEKILEILRLS